MNLLNRQERAGAGLASGSVLLIGGSVAASSLLGGYPVLGGQQKSCREVADGLAAEDGVAAEQAGGGHGPADQQHRPGGQPGAGPLLGVQMIHKTSVGPGGH